MPNTKHPSPRADRLDDPVPMDVARPTPGPGDSMVAVSGARPVEGAPRRPPKTLAVGFVEGQFYGSIRSVLHHFGDVRFRSERSFAGASDLLSMVRGESFDQVLMPNPYGNAARLACYRELRKAEVRVIASDRGALPDTWFFDHGFNYDSPSYEPQRWDHPLSAPERDAVRSYIRDLRGSTHALESQGPRRGLEDLRANLGLSDRKVLFVPLQRPNDTVVRYFGGEVGSVEGVVRLAERTLEILDRSEPGRWCVALKKHPLENEHIPALHPRARYVPDSTHVHDLLEMTDGVLVLNSGVGVLSLCFGKPTFHCGEAFYGHPGLSRAVTTPDALAEAILSGSGPDPEKVERFVHHLTSRVYSFCTSKSEVQVGADGSRVRVTTAMRFRNLRVLGEDRPVVNGPHILIASPVIPANVYRGSESRVGAVIRALISRGMTVSLAVLNTSLSRTSSDEIMKSIWAEFPSLKRVEVRRHPKFFTSLPGRTRYMADVVADRVTGAKHRIHGRDTCPASYRELIAELCRQEKPDFLLVNYAKLAPAIPPDFEGTTVVDTHDYQTRFLEEDQRMNGQRLDVHASAFRKSEEHALRAFDRIIAINPEEKDEFARLCPDTPVFFVPAFVEASYTPHDLFWGGGGGALFVGSQSNFNVSGLLWFVDSVLPRIREHAPDFRLTVVGNIKRAKAVVGRKWDGVDFLGIVPSLTPYYDSASCVIAPLLGGAGMKIKVVEALGYGKAIVATPTALEGIQVSDGRDALVAESPQDFADAVLRVMQDKDLRRRLEEGARRLHHGSHSPEAVSEVLGNVFRT